MAMAVAVALRGAGRRGSGGRGRRRCSRGGARGRGRGAVVRHGEVDLVVERAVLRDGDEARLVVRRGVDARHAVRAGGEATGDGDAEHAVDGERVDALEELEHGRVEHRRRGETVDRLDDDVRVADNVAVAVHLLRRAVVVARRVDEVARLEVVDAHRDGEVRVRGDGAAVRRERELGGRHVRLRGDDAHRRGVARAREDLRAVRDLLAGDREAEVDEVELAVVLVTGATVVVLEEL